MKIVEPSDIALNCISATLPLAYVFTALPSHSADILPSSIITVIANCSSSVFPPLTTVKGLPSIGLKVYTPSGMSPYNALSPSMVSDAEGFMGTSCVAPPHSSMTSSRLTAICIILFVIYITELEKILLTCYNVTEFHFYDFQTMRVPYNSATV